MAGGRAESAGPVHRQGPAPGNDNHGQVHPSGARVVASSRNCRRRCAMARRDVGRSKMSKQPPGMKKGLTAYGDPGFSLFLRTAFLKAMGYSE